MEACAAVALWTSVSPSVSLPDIAWRASTVWDGTIGRRRWACAADSSSESISSRTPPRNLRGYGLPTTASLPDTHGLQAQPGMGQSVAGIEPAQSILQRAHPFPDTATKPAWLRPSDKYIPSRTCMARKDDLERGKPARNMKDRDRSEIQPHSDAMHANAVGLKRTEREYCLRYIHWGMRPLRAPNNGRKRRSVPLRVWTLDDLWHAKAQQSSQPRRKIQAPDGVPLQETPRGVLYAGGAQSEPQVTAGL